MSDSNLNAAVTPQKLATKEISKIILILIIPIAFVAYRYFTAPPAGFCVAQNRFVPAEEFAKKVIFPESVNNNTKNLLVYDCCEVYRLKGGFIAKVLQLDLGVSVHFQLEHPSTKSSSSADGEGKVEKRIILDSCANSRVPEDDGRAPWSREDFVTWDAATIEKVVLH